MHVILLADPELPVPPRLYGGIERIVDMLAEGLVERGHRVTLFAHPASRAAGELRPWRGRRSRSARCTALHVAQVASYVLPRIAPDLVVHSFARLAYLTPLLPLPVPKLQSYQREIRGRNVRWGDALSRGTLEFTACSARCASSGGEAGTWHVIHNGVDTRRFDFVPSVAPDAPLVFLGRVEPIKGAHLAVDVARRAGRRLKIAGNLPTSGPHVDYAQRLIAECDGDQVEYVGPVDDRQKNELLGGAACLVFPIQWEEPFGIVMAEALACGTPVLGFPRGSVPEVVAHGVTGFVCDDVAGMAEAVSRVGSLSRARCRAEAEERFSAEVLVPQYEALYRRLVAGCAPSGAA